MHVLDDADAKGYVKPSRGGTNHHLERRSARMKETNKLLRSRGAGPPTVDTTVVGVDDNRVNTMDSHHTDASRVARGGLGTRLKDLASQPGEGVSAINSSEATPKTVGGLGAVGNGHSVLLRRIAFSSEESLAAEAESGAGGASQTKMTHTFVFSSNRESSGALSEHINESEVLHGGRELGRGGSQHVGMAAGQTPGEPSCLDDGSILSGSTMSSDSRPSRGSSALSPNSR